MIRVGLLIGHYGQDTGASFNNRDEWLNCLFDAHSLEKLLVADGKLDPIFIYIDKTQHPWDLVQEVSRISPPSFLGGFGNIELRALWAIRENVQAALEFHLNRSLLNTLINRKATGHEVFIRRMPGPKTVRLGELLIEEFGKRLGNKSRGLKRKNYRILRKLHSANIPAAILEPAFLAEDMIVRKRWRDNYVLAVRAALYRFFNL